jgi:hypothetical protein
MEYLIGLLKKHFKNKNNNITILLYYYNIILLYINYNNF